MAKLEARDLMRKPVKTCPFVVDTFALAILYPEMCEVVEEPDHPLHVQNVQLNARPLPAMTAEPPAADSSIVQRHQVVKESSEPAFFATSAK